VNRALVDDAPSVHPLAAVDPAARLGPGVSVGPFSVIGPHVVLGDCCTVHNNVTITGHTTAGSDNEFYPGCVLGAQPQDLKYCGTRTLLHIGHHNIFREQVTAHPGTERGGGVTRLGDHNLLMIGMHVGHDVIIGNHCILANLCLLAGHVLIEDYVTIGGHAGVHHFTTIGKHAMVGGMTKIAADVPPFLTVAGTRSSRQEVRMVNGVGLKRCGLFTEAQIRRLKEAHMRIFSRRARSKPMLQVVRELESEASDENVLYLCEFLLRSFECGRHGRYLESLRRHPPAPPSSTDEGQPD